ncbi:MAG: hypothetical protein IPP51_04055 [Bacteroidetes bacterium]|nr:hypothetical protein [Bacteroidota bacterium]
MIQISGYEQMLIKKSSETHQTDADFWPKRGLEFSVIFPHPTERIIHLFAPTVYNLIRLKSKYLLLLRYFFMIFGVTNLSSVFSRFMRERRKDKVKKYTSKKPITD